MIYQVTEKGWLLDTQEDALLSDQTAENATLAAYAYVRQQKLLGKLTKSDLNRMKKYGIHTRVKGGTGWTTIPWNKVAPHLGM